MTGFMKQCKKQSMKYEPSTTRQSILDSAAALIRKAGSVRDLTVRRIIEAAGVNLNAVNYHFGSKEALIREAVRAVIGEYFRERGIQPGSTGPGLRKNLARILIVRIALALAPQAVWISLQILSASSDGPPGPASDEAALPIAARTRSTAVTRAALSEIGRRPGIN